MFLSCHSERSEEPPHLSLFVFRSHQLGYGLKSSSCYAETPDYSWSSPAYPSAVPSPQPATADSAPCAKSTSAASLPSESAALPYAYPSVEYRSPGTHAYPPACDPESLPYCRCP